MKHPSLHPRAIHPARSFPAIVAIAIGLAFTPSGAGAATLYWDGTDSTADADGGSGTWNTTLVNWDSAATAGSAATWSNSTPDSAVFGGTAGTVTLGGAITANSVTLGVDGYTITGQTLTVAGGGITANGDTAIASNMALGGTPQTWTVADGKTLTLASDTRMSINGSRTLNFGSAGGTITFQGAGAFSVGDQSAGTFRHSNGTINVTTTSEGFGLGLNIGYRIGGNGTYNLSGGTLNSLGSFVTLGAGGGNTGTWNVTGGTANVRGIGLTTSASATGTFTLTGGRVNIGAYGIANAGGGGTRNKNLGGGTIGALANWSSSENMTLTGTNGNVTFNTLDASDGTTARTIALSGALSGTGGLIKDGDGTLTLSGTNTYTGPTTVAAGVLALSGSGSISGSATIDVASGATLDVSGMSGSPWTLGASQTLEGNGTVYGGLTAAGHIAPGNSIGTLNVTGDLTINGTLDVEYDGDGSLIDLLAVTGNLDISGATVDFSPLNSALTGSPHIFASYGSLTGSQFNVVTDLPAGYTIDYNYAGNNIALIPEPTAALLAGLGALGLLRRRRHS